MVGFHGDAGHGDQGPDGYEGEPNVYPVGSHLPCIVSFARTLTTESGGINH
jgi:hypothetical protein